MRKLHGLITWKSILIVISFVLAILVFDINASAQGQYGYDGYMSGGAMGFGAMSGPGGLTWSMPSTHGYMGAMSGPSLGAMSAGAMGAMGAMSDGGGFRWSMPSFVASPGGMTWSMPRPGGDKMDTGVRNSWGSSIVLVFDSYTYDTCGSSHSSIIPSNIIPFNSIYGGEYAPYYSNNNFNQLYPLTYYSTYSTCFFCPSYDSPGDQSGPYSFSGSSSYIHSSLVPSPSPAF